jgi:hypothetical protein
MRLPSADFDLGLVKGGQVGQIDIFDRFAVLCGAGGAT